MIIMKFNEIKATLRVRKYSKSVYLYGYLKEKMLRHGIRNAKYEFGN